MSFVPSRLHPGLLGLALAFVPAAAGAGTLFESPAQAADVQRVDAAVRGHAQAHARIAQARGDAASVAAAAVLLAPRGAADEDRRTALAWLDEALRRHPDDAGLAWAGLRACGGDPACDRQPWLDRLARLQPGNAAVWVAHLEQADARSRAVLLERARAAPDWQPAATVLRAAVLDAWQAIELAPATAAAIGRLLGEVAPTGSARDDRLAPAYKMAMAQATDLHDLAAFGALTRACLGHGDGAAACAPLWRRIADQGQSLLEAGLATARLAELAGDAGDDSDHRHWRAERAAIAWQERQAAALLDGEFDTAGFWTLLRAQGELAALRRLLGEAGVPLVPPPGHDPAGANGVSPLWSSAVADEAG